MRDSQLIRTWSEGQFKLELYDLGRHDEYGKWVLGYRLYYAGSLVFEGEDFHCSPLHLIDSDAAVGGILTFLSLRPGDTDENYFTSYTPEQLNFAHRHGEELATYASDLETGHNRVRLEIGRA